MNHETPRTDASEPQLHSNKGGWVRADFARELEQELAASQAEVEELQQQKRNCIEIIDDDAKEIAELKAEVEKLKVEYWFMEEALNKEIEALKDQLKRSVEIARAFLKLVNKGEPDGWCEWDFEDKTKASNDFANLCKEIL